MIPEIKRREEIAGETGVYFATGQVLCGLLKAVFEDFSSFKSRHLAYGHSKPENMVSEGLSAPLHDTAQAYYTAKGWIK